MSREQLLGLGLRPQAIKHRVRSKWLHPVVRGVYAVGRTELTRYGRWMAAVLRCGPEAALSHETAGQLWEMRRASGARIEVTVRRQGPRRPPGIAVHRRAALSREEVTRRYGIPVTTPVCTLVDLGARLPRRELEAAINEADKLDLVHPQRLRSALEAIPRRPGLAALRELLDEQTFTLTDSDLERLFLPIARRAGLPLPRTQARVNGFRADFFWPELGLVVETDGGRYHRTPAQQTADRLRDQAHLATGLTPLRFTHAQVRFHADHVHATLRAVATRLTGRG